MRIKPELFSGPFRCCDSSAFLGTLRTISGCPHVVAHQQFRRLMGSTIDPMDAKNRWTVEYNEESNFSSFFRNLNTYEQAVVRAAIEQVLETLGPEICAGRWGRPLGGCLVEFRIDATLRALLDADRALELGFGGQHPRVLVRLFCVFHGQRIVLIHHGYNKGKSPGPKRQSKEIRVARNIHEAWKRKID